MNKSETKEYIFSRSELIYILHQFNIKSVVGMKLDEFNLPEQEINKLLKIGKEQLIEHGYIKSINSGKIISSELTNLVKTIGFRDFALVIICGIRDFGKQLFMFNFYDNFIVEHTFPEEGKHRLALISSIDQFRKLLDQLIPLQPIKHEGRPEFKISQSEFENALQILRSGEKASATHIFNDAGLKTDLAERFLGCLELPEFTLSIACFLINNDEIKNTASVSVFADRQSSWGIWPDNIKVDPPILLIFPSDITDIYAVIQDWLRLRK